MDEGAGRFEFRALKIGPAATIIHRSIRDPVMIRLGVETTKLKIHHTSAGNEMIPLIR